jgi:hypothetical protein
VLKETMMDEFDGVMDLGVPDDVNMMLIVHAKGS